MRELHICAKLEHRNIIELIAASWDFSEGDLHKTTLIYELASRGCMASLIGDGLHVTRHMLLDVANAMAVSMRLVPGLMQRVQLLLDFSTDVILHI